MSQLDPGAMFWPSIVMVLCLGLIMLFDTFKRVFDETGALYEIEYRSLTAKDHVFIRLISASMILFFLFRMTQGESFSNGNSLTVMTLALFILMFARTYSREQNYASIYFKGDFLRIGFTKYRYDEVQFNQENGRVEIREQSTQRVVCSFPSKYFNAADFIDFVEVHGLQDRLKFSSRTNA